MTRSRHQPTVEKNRAAIGRERDEVEGCGFRGSASFRSRLSRVGLPIPCGRATAQLDRFSIYPKRQRVVVNISTLAPDRLPLAGVRRNVLPLTAASPTKVISWTDAKSSKRIAATPVPAPLKTSAIEAKLQRVDLTYMITMTGGVGLQ